MKLKITSVALLSLWLLLPAQSFATEVQTDEKPVLLGVLGDSLTAAALANIPLLGTGVPDQNLDDDVTGDPEAELVSRKKKRQIRRWLHDKLQPETVLENKRTLSWASGVLLGSHYLRLRGYMRRTGDARTLKVLNVAHSGDKAANMPKQAKKLVRQIKKGKYSELTYVTMLIGHNDACDGTPPAAFRASLMRAFKILSRIKQKERIRILLPGVVRIPDAGLPEVRKQRTLFGLSCHTVRNKVLSLCNSLTDWNTQEEYEEGLAVIAATNALLRSVAEEASARFPKLDIHYSDALSVRMIGVDHLAADCFHASAVGQQLLSDLLWDDQPWFK